MAEMTVTLRYDEGLALLRLAARERREPNEQAAYLIRLQLEELDLLPLPPPPNESRAAKLEAIWKRAIRLYPYLKELEKNINGE